MILGLRTSGRPPRNDGSNQRSDEHDNPGAEFLLRTREIVAEGKSAYGQVGSPKQVEKLAELDAKLAFGRSIGEIPPAEEPWGPQRVARERLASEWKFGEPSPIIPEHTAAINKQRFDQLTAFDDRRLAQMTDEVAADLQDHPTVTGTPHAG